MAKKETQLTDAELIPRMTHGWLNPYLLRASDHYDGRWSYWIASLQYGKPLDCPIPQTDFLGQGDTETFKNINTCLEVAREHGFREALWKFCDWLLWGFNRHEIRSLPDLPERVLATWYRTFNLNLWLEHPYDYLGEIAAEHYGAGKRNRTGYYPTPMDVSKIMAMMIFTKEQEPTESVLDPCVGSGRLLMVASNYSLNLWGMDIDTNILKICTINMAVYVPWAIGRPDDFKMTAPNFMAQPIMQCDSETQKHYMAQSTQMEFISEEQDEAEGRIRPQPKRKRRKRKVAVSPVDRGRQITFF